MRTLRVHEEERLSWDDLFKHPVFGNFFNKDIQQNESLENVFKKVMTDIRF